MPCTPSSAPFTDLVQPTSTVSATPPADSFDPGTAYLLAQCCALSYAQFDSGTITEADFSALELSGSLAGFTVEASNLTPFTVSEADEPGPTTGDVGDYYQSQGGFGVLLKLTSGDTTYEWTVLTLRGTRTFSEWLQDAESLPVPFAPGPHVWEADGQGTVHAGFYGDYTVGNTGATVASSLALSGTYTDRATGSLAAQVGEYLHGKTGLTVYVTGHSLGAALATLCAMDVAVNLSAGVSTLTLYALASPRVAVGLSDSLGVPIPVLGNQNLFVKNFQSYVPNTYQIVHAADIVPILPPLTTTIGPLTVNCAHVTDPWEGSGATATAVISDGAVTAVEVDSSGSDYAVNAPPPVTFSGGDGWGATAKASVGTFPQLGQVVSVDVVDGGTEYTSPPSVTIGYSGSGLCANVISFCAQTGDVGANHSCVGTYVPYLQALAGGFA